MRTLPVCLILRSYPRRGQMRSMLLSLLERYLIFLLRPWSMGTLPTHMGILPRVPKFVLGLNSAGFLEIFGTGPKEHWGADLMTGEYN